MKKTTLEALVNYLNGQTVDNLDEIKAELTAELNKGAEKKAQNDKLYEDAKVVVVEALEGATVTIGELWEAVKDKTPEGFTKGQLQYAVTRLWGDVIGKNEGKVNTYYLKA